MVLDRVVTSLGEKIKHDIQENNLNGSAIARKMNVSRQVINQINLRKKFDIEFLQKLKEASGLDYTKYAYDNAIKTAMLEDGAQLDLNSLGNVTLTLNVSCKRDRVAEFANFLAEVEAIANKYEYRLA